MQNVGMVNVDWRFSTRDDLANFLMVWKILRPVSNRSFSFTCAYPIPSWFLRQKSYAQRKSGKNPQLSETEWSTWTCESLPSLTASQFCFFSFFAVRKNRLRYSIVLTTCVYATRIQHSGWFSNDYGSPFSEDFNRHHDFGKYSRLKRYCNILILLVDPRAFRKRKIYCLWSQT